MPEDWETGAARKGRRKSLRQELLANLEARGLTEQIYRDRVADYLQLKRTRDELEKDIKERGVTVMDAKRGLPVENCSVSARIRVAAQMDRIFKALGFQDLAAKSQGPNPNDDDGL